MMTDETKRFQTWQNAAIVATIINATLCMAWVFPCVAGVPLGVMGILKAHKAEAFAKANNIEAASAYVKGAKTWIIWSFFVAILGILFVSAIFLAFLLFGYVLLNGR